MAENDDVLRPERRAHDQDCWRAMQSAYTEYRRASDALESADQSIDDSPTTELVRLGVLERHQRVSFEHYLEARIDFLEFQYDETKRQAAAQVLPPVPEEEPSRMDVWLASGKRMLPALAVILLSVTMFWLLRQNRQVRELEAARDELRVTLRDTRNEMQLLSQQPGAAVPLQAAAPAPAPRAAVRKPRETKPLRSQPPVHGMQKQPRNGNPTRKAGARRSERTTAYMLR